MSFFKSLFGSQKTPVETDVIKDDVIDFLLDWSKEMAINLADFKEQYFDEFFESVEKQNADNSYFTEQIEAVKHQCFFKILGNFLVVKDPNTDKIKQFIELLHHNRKNYDLIHLNNIDDNYSRRNGDFVNLADLHEKAITKLKLNAFIFYHKRLNKLDDFISNSGFEYTMGQLQHSDKELFESHLHHFNVFYKEDNKMMLLLEIKNYKSYDEEVLSPSKNLDPSLEESMANFNNNHVMQLNAPCLAVVNSFIDEIKELHYAKARKLPPSLIDATQVAITDFGRAAVVNALVYVYQNSYTHLNDSIGKKWTDLILTQNESSEEWLKEVLNNGKANGLRFGLETMYAPLVLRNTHRANYTPNFIENDIEALVFEGLKTEPHPELLDLIRENYEKKHSDNPVVKDIYQQMYSGVFSTILREDPKNTKQVNRLVDLLSRLGECSLIEVYKDESWREDEEQLLCKISFNQQEYHLHRSGEFLSDLTSILKAHQLAYCPLEFTVAKDEDDQRNTINSLGFLTKAQIDFLKKENQLGDIGEYLTQESPLFYCLENSAMEDNSSSIGWFIEKYLGDHPSKKVFQLVFDELIGVKPSKKLSQKWFSTVDDNREQITVNEFFNSINYIFSAFKNEEFWMSETFMVLQKNMTLYALHHFNDLQAQRYCKNTIDNTYTKIAGIGPKSAALGNYVMEMLAKSDAEEAFGILIQFRNSTKYNRFLVALDKYIDLFLATTTASAELLADKTVPRFGFNTEGIEEIKIEDEGSILLRIKNLKVVSSWMTLDGKELKSIPANVKTNFDLKPVNAYIKDINKTLIQLRARIRTFWLNERRWTKDEWTELILEHPLMRYFAQHMVWTTTDDKSFIYTDDFICRDIHHKEVTLNANELISLWHPIQATANSVTDWQIYMLDKQLKQPEKQVFRESYPLTKNEKKESLRFENHFLLNDKLMAICNTIGWRYSYVHEGDNHPRKYLKHQDITAHFNLVYDRYNTANCSTEVFLSQGRNEKDSQLVKANLTLIPIEEIDPTVLSEIFRDIDLMVATTSIVNNPLLKDEFDFYDDYFQNYMLGELSYSASANNRKQILTNLGTMFELNILGFESNFLLIKGQLNEYKINLGSGFVQNRATNKHIDMRVDPASMLKIKKYRLPLFEDDTLTIIIAKAKLLTHDASIESQNLIDQI